MMHCMGFDDESNKKMKHGYSGDCSIRVTVSWYKFISGRTIGEEKRITGKNNGNFKSMMCSSLYRAGV